ncbi:MAG: DUF2249 domain-containing protein [Gammaproteobacteria bacterium]|nr:DUF2249 domain-containing protein [Gammaproteobacteria bacterium]
MPYKHQFDFTLLEPPEPMEKALDVIETLQSGDYLSMLFPLQPVPLFALLKQYGIDYFSRPGYGDAWEVLVWRDGDRKAEEAMRTDASLVEKKGL